MSYRIVFDTNCIISALLFSRQKMARLRYSWQSDAVIPLVCKETVSELLRVLTYPKFKLTRDERLLLLADFLPYAETITVLDVPSNLPVIRDSADQIFLTLAVVGNADALVTGDNDLLTIKDSFKMLPIMSLNEFNQWLK
uniref:PIN domain-containing protein n=1 Tax=Chlorobium chlorochromatii (strain CaD3) TaxID=340177 RepID=Q3ASS4_CHLCH